MMKNLLNIKESPQILLLYTTIAYLFISLFKPALTIDLQDSTMFSFPLSLILRIIPLFLAGFWLLYLISKKFLFSITLTRIHIFITVCSVIFMIALLYAGINPSPSIIAKQKLVGYEMQILFIVFVCGQFLYPVNLLAGFFRKNAK